MTKAERLFELTLLLRSRRTAMPPADQFWSDCTATVNDRFGNIWHVATRVEEVSSEELQRRIEAMAGC